MLFDDNYVRNFKNRVAFLHNASLRIAVARMTLLLCIALGFAASHAGAAESDEKTKEAPPELISPGADTSASGVPVDACKGKTGSKLTTCLNQGSAPAPTAEPAEAAASAQVVEPPGNDQLAEIQLLRTAQAEKEILSYMNSTVKAVSVVSNESLNMSPEAKNQVIKFLDGVDCRLRATGEQKTACPTMDQLRTDHVATIRALAIQEGGQKFGLSTVVVTGCMSALLGGLLVGLFMWRFARPRAIHENVPRTALSDKLDLRNSEASIDAMRGNDPKNQWSTPPTDRHPVVPPQPVQPSPPQISPVQPVQPRHEPPPQQQVAPMPPRPVPPPAQPALPRSVQPPQQPIPIKAFGLDDLLKVVRNNLAALVDSKFVRGDELVAKMASELASSSVKFETWNMSYTRQDSSKEWCYLRCDAKFTDGSGQSILCIAPGTKPLDSARAYFDGLDANLGMDAKVRRTQSPAVLDPNSGGANPACLKKGTVEMKK